MFGSEIDTFDEVMRFNMPPTSGYEAHVGSKITMAVTKVTAWKDDDDTRQRREQFAGQILQNIARDNNTSVQTWLQDPMCASQQVKLCDEQSQRMQRTCKDDLARVEDTCGRLSANLAPGRLVCHRMSQEMIDHAWHMANEGPPAITLNFAPENAAKSAPGLTCLQRAPSSGLIGVLHAMRRCSEVRLFGFMMPSSGKRYYDPRDSGTVAFNNASETWPFYDHVFESSLFAAMRSGKLHNVTVAGLGDIDDAEPSPSPSPEPFPSPSPSPSSTDLSASSPLPSPSPAA